MNEADLDWLVYHLILSYPEKTHEDLARSAGCGEDELQDSLDRLTRYLLIEHQGSGYRCLSHQEMVVKCQSTYDQSLSYTFEGGVIRARKKEGQ